MKQKITSTLFLILGLTIFIQELNMQSELSPILADLVNIKVEIESLPDNGGTIAFTVESVETSLNAVTRKYNKLQERKSILWLSGVISMISLFSLLFSFKNPDRPVSMIRLP